MHKSPDYRNPALLSARKFLHRLIEIPLGKDFRKGLFDSLFSKIRTYSKNIGHRVQILKQPVFLKHCRKANSVFQDLAGIGFQKPHNEIQERGLTCSGCSANKVSSSTFKLVTEIGYNLLILE